MQRLVSVTCPGGEGVDGARRDVGEGLKPRDRQGREQTLPRCSSVSGGGGLPPQKGFKAGRK